MKWLLPLVAVLLCLGCASEQSGSAPDVKVETEAANESALSLEGPGGSVKIGGTLDDAKAAFPAPEEAEVIEQSMSFAIVSDEGWSWSHGMGTGFEVAYKDDKVTAIALTELDGPKDESEVQSLIEKIGEPTRFSDGDSAAIYVWVSGDYARFYVLLKQEMPLFGVGAMTIIGPKEELKMLNYRYDDPDTFVKQMDATAKQFKDLQNKSQQD